MNCGRRGTIADFGLGIADLLAIRPLNRDLPAMSGSISIFSLVKRTVLLLVKLKRAINFRAGTKKSEDSSVDLVTRLETNQRLTRARVSP